MKENKLRYHLDHDLPLAVHQTVEHTAFFLGGNWSNWNISTMLSL